MLHGDTLHWGHFSPAKWLVKVSLVKRVSLYVFKEFPLKFVLRSFRDHSVSRHLSDLRADNKKLLSDREGLRRLLADR